MTHIPVLLKEVIEGLRLEAGLTVLDATINRAGHSIKIAELIGKNGTLIGIDKDGEAIREARGNLSRFEGRLILDDSGYENLDQILEKFGIESIDRALFDLGLSSNQLDESKRGFSFKGDQPLLMTFKDSPKDGDITAEIILNEWEEESIADILYGFGGERFSRRIAKAIVERRAVKPFKTTQDLVSVIEEAVPASYKRGKIRCATKTFQALRMAVNNEVNVIKAGLTKAFEKLSKGGELLVISFHEVEDRIVKNFMKEIESSDWGKRSRKKPIVPSKEEVSENPRSRSAKLRIITKTNDTKSSHNWKHAT